MTNAENIRVLIVGPGAPMVGGQAVQAKRLLDKFKDEPDIDADFLPINPSFIPALQKIKYVRTCLTTTRFIFSLLGNVRKYDVVHIFSASFSSFWLAVLPAFLVAKMFRRPVLLNYRSGYAEKHLNSSMVARWVLGSCDSLVVPSGYLVDVFEKFGLKAESVFNSVDAGKFGSGERSGVRPTFLSNRNFEDLYNVECTIRAFSLIQKEVPDASIVVAGDGPQKHVLHALAEELGVHNIEFSGSVSHDNMVLLYNNADFYLNSPNIDNMPNSIIEAFAAGCVVISTNAGGIPYIVEHGRNGILVGVGDYKSLAAEALKLLRNPGSASKLAAEAKREAVKYSWIRVKENWKDIYRKLAGLERNKS